MRRDVVEDLALAEASLWLVRLQDPARTATVESAFRAWLAEDSRHARAFSRVTDTWEIVPGAVRQAAAATKTAEWPVRPMRWMALTAGMACMVAVAGVVLQLLRDPVYQTSVGEQRMVTLADGSRLTLNTSTRLVVDYGDKQRRIRLERGEALFEVAKNPQRPFVVEAGSEQVRALGTTFVVRNQAKRVDVMLIEGRVQVDRQIASAAAGVRAAPILLAPGERMVLRAEAAAPAVDRPAVEEVTAWRRGEAMFDNATLAEAVAEINRYGKTQVSIGDPALAGLRISGVFATRDTAEFAHVVAKLHGLEAVPGDAGITLIRATTR
ncbi:MAG TPA: FecR domain-containing protein [Roseateles sp.]|nr:FecR domain-containing protein [Roseateles sp.]